MQCALTTHDYVTVQYYQNTVGVADFPCFTTFPHTVKFNFS